MGAGDVRDLIRQRLGIKPDDAPLILRYAFQETVVPLTLHIPAGTWRVCIGPPRINPLGLPLVRSGRSVLGFSSHPLSLLYGKH